MAKKTAKEKAVAQMNRYDGEVDDRPSPAKPSSLLDTRVVYCGDNLEQLAKLPDGRAYNCSRVYVRMGSL
jgi:hypothetical protein